MNIKVCYCYGIVFNAQFINDGAPTLSRTLIGNLILKVKKRSNIDRIYVPDSENHKLEQTDFTAVHNSPSIGTGPET